MEGEDQGQGEEYQEDEYQEVGGDEDEEDEEEEEEDQAGEELEELEEDEDDDNEGEVVLTMGGGRSMGRGFGGRGTRSDQLRRPAVEDSDDERADLDMQLLQEACLPVLGAPLPPSEGPPKDADEYLRQVQWERMHCPEVVDVDVPEKPFKERKRVGGGLLARLVASEAHEADPPAYGPEWAADAAAAFRALRMRVDEGRKRARRGGQQGKMTFAAWRTHCAQHRPSTAFLVEKDFVSLNRLIVVSVEALAKAEQDTSSASASAGTAAPPPPADEPEVHAPDASAAAGGGSQPGPGGSSAGKLDLQRLDLLVEWAFAALACVEEPLVDDIQYQLQQLRRVCHKLVSTAKAQGGSLELVARASLLLVVVKEVFGQR